MSDVEMGVTADGVRYRPEDKKKVEAAAAGVSPDEVASVVEMVVVDGIRYRADNAPKGAKKREPDVVGGNVTTRARAPKSAASK